MTDNMLMEESNKPFSCHRSIKNLTCEVSIYAQNRENQVPSSLDKSRTDWTALPKASISPLACNSAFILQTLINANEHVQIVDKFSEAALECSMEELIPLNCNPCYLLACEKQQVQCSFEGTHADIKAKLSADMSLKFT
jgi:hypothetical protein